MIILLENELKFIACVDLCSIIFSNDTYVVEVDTMRCHEFLQ